MKSQTKRILTVLGVLVLTVILFTGTALADPDTPIGESQSGNGLTRMVDWIGPENWGQMIQRMTQIHGAEFTGQMLQWMNESGSCHNADDAGSASMMGRGFGGHMDSSFQGGMIGRGMNR